MIVLSVWNKNKSDMNTEDMLKLFFFFKERERNHLNRKTFFFLEEKNNYETW
jgi:hypothetical protein